MARTHYIRSCDHRRISLFSNDHGTSALGETFCLERLYKRGPFKSMKGRRAKPAKTINKFAKWKSLALKGSKFEPALVQWLMRWVCGMQVVEFIPGVQFFILFNIPFTVRCRASFLHPLNTGEPYLIATFLVFMIRSWLSAYSMFFSYKKLQILYIWAQCRHRLQKIWSDLI